MKKILFFLPLYLLFFSCHNTQSANNKPLSVKEQTEVQTKVSSSKSDTVVLKLTDGKGEIKLHKNKSQTRYVEFQSGDYKKMYARISTTDKFANVRFSQIIMPDGTMDGPFGREMNYDIPLNGKYILLVNESLMAGDPWEGDFEVEVALSR